jgi:hypothetical protein
MTISKANFTQHVDTVKNYAPKATGALLLTDGAVRIIQTIYARKQQAQNETNAEALKDLPAGVKVAPKKNWDVLSRFKLTGVQNGIVAISEMVAGVYLLSKK